MGNGKKRKITLFLTILTSLIVVILLIKRLIVTIAGPSIL